VINSVPFTGNAIAICKAICSVKVLILSVIDFEDSIIGITVSFTNSKPSDLDVFDKNQDYSAHSTKSY
jgi:hypothetical protein